MWLLAFPLIGCEAGQELRLVGAARPLAFVGGGTAVAAGAGPGVAVEGGGRGAAPTAGWVVSPLHVETAQSPAPCSRA